MKKFLSIVLILMLSAGIIFAQETGTKKPAVVKKATTTTTSPSSNNGGNNGNKNKTGVEPGCNFVKTDNTWKYLSDEHWGFVDVYVWTDETTVRHEIHTNSYHNEDRDEILTNLNRDEFYDQIMAECQLMTSQNAE